MPRTDPFIGVFLGTSAEHDCAIRRARMGGYFDNRQGPGDEDAVAESEESSLRRRDSRAPLDEGE